MNSKKPNFIFFIDASRICLVHRKPQLEIEAQGIKAIKKKRFSFPREYIWKVSIQFPTMFEVAAATL